MRETYGPGPAEDAIARLVFDQMEPYGSWDALDCDERERLAWHVFYTIEAVNGQQQQRITALTAALAREWEYNHSEHCQRTYPHSGICSWPLPDALTPTSAGVAGGAEG